VKDGVHAEIIARVRNVWRPSCHRHPNTFVDL